jgi:hypothetical protein
VAIRGWVYVIMNKSMPGILKVGFTTKDPALRADELNNTGTPFAYEVLYDIHVPDPQGLEQRVHQALDAFHAGKEWFKCSVPHAISAIRAQAGSAKIYETVNEAVSVAITEGSRYADVAKHRTIVKAGHDARLATFICWSCNKPTTDEVAPCRLCGAKHPLAR